MASLTTVRVPLAPADDRAVSLDVLRGLALLGMVVVHFHQRMRIDVGGLADLPGWFVYIFIEQKSWGTFAFLFGVGFAILLRRLEARNAPVVAIYVRRLSALAAFGIITDVGFGFHILLSYACWGLALLGLRHWPTRVLLPLAGLAAAIRPLVAEFAALAGHPVVFGGSPEQVAPLRAAVEAATQQSSYAGLLHARWALFLATFPRDWYDVLPDVNLALFLLGLLACRIGVFDEPLRHTRAIRSGMTFGVVSWGISWLVLPYVPVPAAQGAGAPFEYGFGLLQDQWLCLTYVGAVVLALARHPAWIDRGLLVASAGRMALTNYMVQCAALDFLASGYGVRLRVTPMTGFVAGIVLFSLLAAMSRSWLAYFRYGPLEWLWRTATYWKLPPMRRTPPAARAIA
jgi:uncharacterized protein